MARERTSESTGAEREVCVPAGAPSWVTAELIAQTLRVWQPHYRQELIPEDALDMILNVGRMAEFVQRGGDDEAIHSPGQSEQP